MFEKFFALFSTRSKFKIMKSKNGRQWYWNLQAENGKVIATSEMYESKQAAKNGIKSVRRVAPIANIEEDL